jgi:hypothetical protein
MQTDYNAVNSQGYTGYTVVAGSGNVNMNWMADLIGKSGGRIYGNALLDRDTLYLVKYISPSANIPEAAKEYALTVGINQTVTASLNIPVAINMTWAGVSTFGQFMANSTAHEAGHSFGLVDAYDSNNMNVAPNDIMRAGSDTDPWLSFLGQNPALLQAALGMEPNGDTSLKAALAQYQSTFYLPANPPQLNRDPARRRNLRLGQSELLERGGIGKGSNPLVSPARQHPQGPGLHLRDDDVRPDRGAIDVPAQK